MNTLISFGVACFHFGLKQMPPVGTLGAEYVTWLRASLESVSNITNVQIECDKTFMDAPLPEVAPPPKLADGSPPFPRPEFMDLQFDVYVPHRIQENIVRQIVEGRRPHTFTEQFKVLLRYRYHMPVAFVLPLDSTSEPLPSDAVVVVREFLQQSFSAKATERIVFEFVGPSPFHGNCYLKDRVERDATSPLNYLAATRSSGNGFTRIVFDCEPSGTSTGQDCLEKVIDEVVDELSFFYHIAITEIERIRMWERIEQPLGELNRVQSLAGLKGLSVRFLRSRGLLNELSLRIADLETNDLMNEGIVQRDYRFIREQSHGTCFVPDMEEELQSRMDYPIAPVLRLVEIFERRHQKSVEVMTISASLIAAGALGALITILAS